MRTNRATRTFSDLQQRLNRKTVTKKMLDDYPAFVRGYDLLFSGGKRHAPGKLPDPPRCTLCPH